MKLCSDIILNYPIQNSLTQAMRQEAVKQSNIDLMSMWAGQACHLKSISVEQLMQKLIEGLG
jgi:nitronate monooxygenase